jgi:hypothetical protein
MLSLTSLQLIFVGLLPRGFDHSTIFDSELLTSVSLFLSLSAEIIKALTFSLTHYFGIKIPERDLPIADALLNSKQIFDDIHTNLHHFFSTIGTTLVLQKRYQTIYALKYVMVLFVERLPIRDFFSLFGIHHLPHHQFVCRYCDL